MGTVERVEVNRMEEDGSDVEMEFEVEVEGNCNGGGLVLLLALSVRTHGMVSNRTRFLPACCARAAESVEVETWVSEVRNAQATR